MHIEQTAVETGKISNLFAAEPARSEVMRPGGLAEAGMRARAAIMDEGEVRPCGGAISDE